MTFAKPEMLWLLAVTAPLLAWFLIWAWRRRQQLIARFVQSRLLAQLTVGVSKWRQQARLALLGLASLLLLVALARPQLGFAWEEVHQRGLDLFVAVDTSRSMLVSDVSPNRLTRAKLAALDLMKLARTDRLALIAFAGTAFLQCPLTLDDNAFQQSVNLLEVGLLPQGGTAIAQAIDVALAAAQSSGDNYKAMVLFTDGEDFGEDFSQDVLVAANRAAEAGLKIFPVGVGTATGDRIRLVDEQGRTTYVLDAAGEPVISKLNAPLLRELAEKTGGDFLPLTGADPMRTLYEARLGRLPKSDVSARLLRQYHERFQWPLAVAIGLLVLELFLPDRKRVPRPPASPAGRGAALPERASQATTLPVGPTAGLAATIRVVILLLVLGAGSVPLAASSASALKAYAKGRFDEASREYERLVEKHPDDARLRFNAGTAAYQTGDLTTATNHLMAATRSTDPLLLQHVYYNLGNAFYRLGENAPAPPAAIALWEQALQHYDSALKLDAEDGDARFNREFVQQRLEALKQQQQQSPDPSSEPPPKREPSEAGRQAKAQADAAVIRKEYRRAYELMTALSESDQAYYADYLKRLQDTLGLVDPASP